ncbi:putative drug exporter of the RND superfamily [Quadrisphaera granulorum]|uniref:RND superfamily putative drug exporter n=1 Tax=Quadrisphaera granulorum TaxID=317664 RepID=A0A316A698_9ACTN|nr:MMPL family transporter [Quadrisphaera granulorum]PWJ53012.1 RND superfamily putative drug exporter [Quadrisphaera granulorum]SZE97177.1 putative drug exporter of the RND superfamily [Quadrisphaera granulorum]
MARWLFALGLRSARRPRTVLGTWGVLLALGVAGYLAFGGALSSQVSLPGTPTAKVVDQLQREFPDASGGSATVVFHSDDDAALTDAQRSAIAAVLQRVATTPGVKGAIDPFASTAQREQQVQQLTDGQQKVQAARAQLDDSQAQLDAGRAQLEGVLSSMPGGFPGQARVRAQLAALDQQQAQLDAGKAQLDEQARQVDLGSRLVTAADGVRQVSADGSTALGVVQFSIPLQEVTPETKKAVADALTGENQPAGVQVALSQDLVQEVPEVFGPGEALGLVVAAITLFVVLTTAIAAAVPIVSAVVGVGVGVTAALSLSGVVDMISVTPMLGVMLGLAVGIDYSLFLLNRHRRQLLHGMPLRESIALATGTAGNAVVFAGLTVVIALAALNVTGIGFLGLMGTVGAFCVLVAVAMAVTFTPAVLSLLGARVLRRRERTFYGRHDAAAEEQRRAAAEAETARQAALRPMGTVRAALTVVLGVAVLGVLAIPAASLRLGLPDGSSESVDSTQYQAFMLTEKYFGAGANGPLLVVADLPQPLTGTDQLAEQVRVAEEIRGLADVAAVAPIGASADQRLLAFQVVPDSGPTAVATEQLVKDIRALPEGYGVAGSASGNIDVSEQLAGALPGYLGLVVGLSLLILVVVFRSLLVPVTATLGFVLSLFATLGAITAVYQWGWLGSVFGVSTPGPVLSFLPTIVIGIMFGLAMDYQLFLVSGMREAYAHGMDPRTAVTAGVRAGRRVVIAAAIIMISVFGGFSGSDSVIIRAFGFGLAFGVLADAFLVRLLIIPAVMHLLGRSAWWIPRWLARIIPDVDVEGASLERHGAAVVPEPSRS